MTRLPRTVSEQVVREQDHFLAPRVVVRDAAALREVRAEAGRHADGLVVQHVVAAFEGTFPCEQNQHVDFYSAWWRVL